MLHVGISAIASSSKQSDRIRAKFSLHVGISAIAHTKIQTYASVEVVPRLEQELKEVVCERSLIGLLHSRSNRSYPKLQRIDEITLHWLMPYLHPDQ
ncbi:hypothetical protein NDI37_26915 [Funiculus sociatus GB2-A5]|uniref:Uncharacterized protein n=1 Tax=Funiculus sociatus GB2-A5 TaxID=2933946 RepID=A0ABV0JXI0_9CYAN|nr:MULTISPECIES: hypothetical protein [unclassified Trichocoleus]MBD1905931.1 hypothetical protein [Trichocoleus sp. FACHB-832]MBD2061184.1 hypothetical protein [Trichocoleus sp. FACHB-6]